MTTSPQDDLTAERAAIALLEQMGLYGHPAASQFIGDILAALKTTRQEALREAAKVAEDEVDEGDVHDDWTAGYVRALQDISAKLDRLASEGG